MNIDALVAEKALECGCSFSVEKRTLCKPSILEGRFTIFIENGTEPGAPIRILDEEQQKYYSAILTRFDEDGLDFEIVDLRGQMNIDEMPAGRELDALVAEKVMGWTETSNNWGKVSGRPPKGHELYETVGEIIRKVRVPKYSTDLAAAWEVVTRMDAAAFLLERSLTANKAPWCARFGHHEDGRLIGTMTRGTASTPALAICRAALKYTECMEGRDAHNQPLD